MSSLGSTGGKSENYDYDLNGNRDANGFTVTAGNRIGTDGVYTYSYDLEGNINKRSKAANDETWFYGFDHLNRLVSAELRATDDPDGTLLHKEAYDFDVFGNRIAKRVDSDGDGNWNTTERFAYDGNMVWADLDGSNNLTVRRMYGDVIDQVFARIGASGAAWYLTDRLGSSVNIVNNSGTILNTTTYDSFGTPTDSSPANADRYKHTGREWNAVVESGYFRARNTMAGRFMQEDSVIDDPTNKYRYVRNNPLVVTDPTGHWFQTNGAGFQKWASFFADMKINVIPYNWDTGNIQGIPTGYIGSKYLWVPTGHSEFELKKLAEKDSLTEDQQWALR